MPVMRVQRNLLAEQVCRHFVDLIATGELKPGERLPSERDLCSLLGVGRPAVREGLRALHVLNIVEIRQGDGTYITSLEPQLLIRPFDVFFHLGTFTLLQLFECREVLEVGLTELAAARVSESDISDLRLYHQQLTEHMDDPREFNRLDAAFHTIIFRIAHNPLLKSVMESVTSLGRVTREQTAKSAAVRRQAMIDHADIIGALERRDPEASASAMSRHLRNVRTLAGLSGAEAPNSGADD